MRSRQRSRFPAGAAPAGSADRGGLPGGGRARGAAARCGGARRRRAGRRGRRAVPAARMLASIGRNPASDPEAGAAPGGPGRRGGAGAKRASPGRAGEGDVREREREAERRRVPESVCKSGRARPCSSVELRAQRMPCPERPPHAKRGRAAGSGPAKGRVPFLADACCTLRMPWPENPCAGGRQLARRRPHWRQAGCVPHRRSHTSARWG